ncbi:MAG: hypothetical protein FWF32_05190, partial [Endomicrobia bacterium]|nr:hypothetical protein [Endomicrobiia bacterium]
MKRVLHELVNNCGPVLRKVTGLTSTGIELRKRVIAGLTRNLKLLLVLNTFVFLLCVKAYAQTTVSDPAVLQTLLQSGTTQEIIIDSDINYTLAPINVGAGAKTITILGGYILNFTTGTSGNGGAMNLNAGTGITFAGGTTTF